jgi:hypothetical protein
VATREGQWQSSPDRRCWVRGRSNFFCLILQDAYGHLRHKVQLCISCHWGHTIKHSTVEHLFDVINTRGISMLYANEILRDGLTRRGGEIWTGAAQVGRIPTSPIAGTDMAWNFSFANR